MGDPVILEICADSVESAVAAEQGGAHRIELCSSLLEGGVTPSSGLIATVRDRISIGLYVMVRPRGGDFCYGADEFEAMERDVLTAKQLGADGVVFGILQEDGRVDISKTRQLVDLARPLKVTFHRAFDMSSDFGKSLEDVIAAGVDRVLTSGGEQMVESGVETVANLVRKARDRVVIMACGGITRTNVRSIIGKCGVQEIHASVRVPVQSRMRHRNDRISMGAIKGREYERMVVMRDRVSHLLDAAINGVQSSSGTRSSQQGA
jgi:copper homeostasis protein